MSPVRPTTLFALLALTLVGCATGSGAQVELKGHRFGVEIADNDDERSRGLMYRESMDPDHGMLFVFEEDAPQAFWMKNTSIPLDIMYFDGERRFVSAHYRVPTCKYGGNNCPSYPSEGDARYVLELNAGVGAALSLQSGDVITLPGNLNKAR
ncbi:MAG: DUF192 domain-containing protein [Rhodanobacteraceae bacterium]|jgi:hypothetical protein|nr:DUF192 domain-containing protein [Rhodanobacteraceae bacterium]MBL0042763.1 DUF192 domain-containing protein [Xanthomonadales bacterium]MBP6077856.1 DUF192 domain-containing protein [Xanthomonadales bacterium]MBP7623783.1 DUF192 domain-containing protein [Xanthomonadales bacterium]